MNEFPPVVYVDIYKGRRRFRQAWRWRALNAGNREVMASGEAYANEADAWAAVLQLFADVTVDVGLLKQAGMTVGGEPVWVPSNVYARQSEVGNRVLRLHPAVQQ